MSALPVVMAAWLSLGTASAVTWSLCPPLGACTASAPVIFPPLTVTRTCTGPYWVWATAPVSVRVSGAPPPGSWSPAAAPAFTLSSADWSDCLYPALV